MGLFKPDLFRSFAIGFLAGTAIIACAIGPSGLAEALPALATMGVA